MFVEYVERKWNVKLVNICIKVFIYDVKIGFYDF